MHSPVNHPFWEEPLIQPCWEFFPHGGTGAAELRKRREERENAWRQGQPPPSPWGRGQRAPSATHILPPGLRVLLMSKLSCPGVFSHQVSPLGSFCSSSRTAPALPPTPASGSLLCQLSLPCGQAGTRTPGLPAAPAEPLESSQRASLTHRARRSALNAGIGAVMSCAAWPGRLMGAKFFPR